MIMTDPQIYDLDKVKYQIEHGELKIPQFQRDFVWNMSDSAKLMDSIIKGYPIGAFTFWKTKDRLRVVKNIGGLSLPESPKNDYIHYVLDGQQRITSIYACIKGVLIGKADYNKMYIDLVATKDDDIVFLDLDHDRKEHEYISLTDLLQGDLKKIYSHYKEHDEILQRIFEYKDRINKYKFSVIEINDAPLDIATEIFTRINTTGKSLSIFEIMCAKIYDEDLGFDLFEKRKEQLEKWANVDYETVPHQTVLQAVSLCIQKTCKRKDILKIDKRKFIEVWDNVDKAFDETIDYLKNNYGIPVSKLLPYDALLVPIVYYFYFYKEKPTGINAKRLQDYFWRCVFAKRFTEGVEGKLSSDCINVIDEILKDIDPDKRNLSPIDITYTNIKKNGTFSLSSAYIKGIVCIYVAQTPKSFSDGTKVVIDNDWLSRKNSKNYHHFFPIAYMKKNQPLIDSDLVNHIANITIVDEHLNKGKIKDKAPSVYMKTFKDDNKELSSTMQTHLIDLDCFGIWNDDYNQFFDKRIIKIQEQIKNRLIFREYDKEK